MEDFKVYQASGYLTKLVTDASDVRKVYEEISGSMVQFDTPISAPLASLIVDINPVQDLHGQDAPYPVGGGKNKLDAATVFAACSNGDGTYTGSNNQAPLLTGISIPLVAYIGQTVTLSLDVIGKTGTTTVWYLKGTIDGVSNGGNTHNRVLSGSTLPIRIYETFTPVTENDYVEFSYGSGDGTLTIKDIQLEVSPSMTDYAPYSNICPITGWTGANIYHSGEDTSNPTVYTVSWQDDAGTVYGGTVDVVSGVLTVTRVTDTKKWSACTDATTLTTVERRRFYLSSIPKYTMGSASEDVICNIIGYYYANSSDDSIHMYIASTVFASLFLPIGLSEDTDIQFSYSLATPITYQLTPQEINTLIGVNNIWADTGDVSVKYRTH